MHTDRQCGEQLERFGGPARRGDGGGVLGGGIALGDEEQQGRGEGGAGGQAFGGGFFIEVSPLPRAFIGFGKGAPVSKKTEPEAIAKLLEVLERVVLAGVRALARLFDGEQEQKMAERLKVGAQGVERFLALPCGDCRPRKEKRVEVAFGEGQRGAGGGAEGDGIEGGAGGFGESGVLLEAMHLGAGAFLEEEAYLAVAGADEEDFLEVLGDMLEEQKLFAGQERVRRVHCVAQAGSTPASMPNMGMAMK